MTLPRLIETLDPILLASFLLALVALAAILLALRLRGGDSAGLRASEAELRAALGRATGAEALAQERKSEIDRLNGDLSKLRTKLDADAERAETAASRISRLSAQLESALKDAEDTTRRHAETMAELRAEITSLRDRLDTAAVEKQDLTGTINRLQAELRAQKAASEEKIEILGKVRADMEAKFQELAREALKVQGEEFSKANLERLSATLTPLKEHVGHFERELKAVHKATVDDRAALKAEIQQLSKRSEEVSKEALALTRALKSDQQRQGAWGEMVLEGILERSGLREGEEYETQAHRTSDEGGRLRPDVVVRIPGGKSLVIDSKVSLVAYTDAVNAETDVDAEIARKRHIASLRSHINELSAKRYQFAEAASVDYVIMFVPIEGALSEALRQDGALTEYALERHITIATPTTLMMALRTVAHVWAVERRNQNAEEIARRAGLLYDKVAGFVSSMDQVGKRLQQAGTSYDAAMGQLSRGSGNLLRQVETLKTLGAKTSKSLSVEFDDTEESPALEPPEPEGGA
ncbi:DNA recombination protein RmuC [Natronohydrobacter thiooxidans]|uniref:DNA recombination protein RmuC n=1 Tax=Natronohydrobacter thiooxidans TaxID=87172 RepID=UPI0008FF6D17|nr:DNA recombination protein RmuC [Natronohydrobacter thiooxidans]